MPAATFNFGLYAVYLKELKYGRGHYDYQEGTLVFIAPGPVLGVESKVKTFAAKGWALLFHPDLIGGTSLGKHIIVSPFYTTVFGANCCFLTNFQKEKACNQKDVQALNAFEKPICGD